MKALSQLKPANDSLDECTLLLEELLQYCLESPRDGFVPPLLFEAQMLRYKCNNLQSKIILLETELNNLIQDINKIANYFDE